MAQTEGTAHLTPCLFWIASLMVAVFIGMWIGIERSDLHMAYKGLILWLLLLLSAIWLFDWIVPMELPYKPR